MNIKNDVLPLLKDTWAEFQDDEVGNLGAALSYYAVFSIFPLLLLLIAALGFVLQYWNGAQDAQGAILQAVSTNFSPQLSAQLNEILLVVQDQAGAATGVGLVTLALGASGVFQQLDLSFNKIWELPKKKAAPGILNAAKAFLSEKLVSFGMLLAVGFLLLISLALTGVTQLLLQGAGALLGSAGDSPVTQVVGFLIGQITTLALNTVIFGLLYKYLPDVKLTWRDVLPGALVTAIIWEIAKRLLALYIGGSSYASAYGAIGAILVLIAWIYFSSQVLFLGAEFTKVYTRRFGSHARNAAATSTDEAEQAPLLLPAPAVSSASSGKVAAGAGAGLVVGAIGGAIAGVAALLIGTQRAATSVTRLARRKAPGRR